MCLRCVFEEFVPKHSFCKLRVSSILSFSATQPIFQKALQRSLSALKHCRIALSKCIGSPSVIAAADAQDDLPPPIFPVAMPFAKKFHQNNQYITISNANKTALRQGSNGCLPVANALITANECSFQVIIDSDASPSKTIFLGIARKTLPLSDSSGIGPSSSSWGLKYSFGNGSKKSQFVACGSEQAQCRDMRKGGRLLGIVNFEKARFDVFWNDVEAAHTFTIDENLKRDDFVFAVTLATSAQVTIIDKPHVTIKPLDSRGQDPLCCCDNAYVWMQSVTQEVVNIIRPSVCDEKTLVTWFDQAMAAAAALIGDASN
jgi:hypothetical protein